MPSSAAWLGQVKGQESKVEGRKSKVESQNLVVVSFGMASVTKRRSFPSRHGGRNPVRWGLTWTRLRGGDNIGDFHLLGWAAGP